MYSQEVAVTQFHEWLEASMNDENEDVVVEFELGDVALRKFQGWLIVTGSTFDKNWQSLRMRMTHVVKHFGLSRSGVQFSSRWVGWCT